MGELEILSCKGAVRGFHDKMKEAGIRVKAKEDELGKEEYHRIVEEEKQRVLLEGYKKANAMHVHKRLEESGLGKRFFKRTFDTFDVNADNEQAHMACRRVVLGRSNGVLLQGKNGIGKTHLVAATIIELATQGKMVRYGNITDLMQQNLTRCDFLAIDDLGQENAVGYKQDDAKVFFYNIINKLYEQEKGVLITTNLSAKEVGKKYGVAVLSRLQEMCEFISYKDVDHRAKPTD
jgi:DNA replication protein DnaC